ncbi:hypothetical protein IIA15_02610 [candidate division TA06 bacterium]|nr:hypothetical protein [candidate division TA06 bacterium]
MIKTVAVGHLRCQLPACRQAGAEAAAKAGPKLRRRSAVAVAVAGGSSRWVGHSVSQ